MNRLQMTKRALVSYVNAVKFIWSTLAYPLTIVGKNFTNLMDYKIHGNTVYGKNLLDVKKHYGTYANENGGITLHSGQLADFAFNQQKLLKGVFKEKTPYTFSFKYNITEATTVITPRFYYTDGTENHWYIGNYLGSWGDTLTLPSEGTYSFVSNGDKTLDYFVFSYGSNSGTRFECELTNMQIEEGVTATEYEPCNPQSVGELTTKNLLKYDLMGAGHSPGTSYMKSFMISNLIKFDSGTYTLSYNISNATTYRLHWVVFSDNGETELTTKAEADTYATVTLKANRDTGYYNAFNKFFMLNANTTVFYNDVEITVLQPCYIGFHVSGGDMSVKSVVTEQQLELGEVKTDYEPFGKYKIPVTASGKNILDMSKQTVSQGYYNDSSGTINSSNNNLIRISPIAVKPSTKYTISIGTVNSNLVLYSVWFHYGPHETHGISKIFTGKTLKVTFTTPKNCNYICVSMYSSNGAKPEDLEWAMLELGEGDGIYEPYIEPQITNIYLDEPLEYSEVIQKTIDNLPELPQFKGTTIYEIDTSVKPSGMEVKYC